MNQEVGSFDAKTHLSEYLERTSRGERFTITRRGVPLAELGPAETGDQARNALLVSFAELRARIAAAGTAISVADMVREDRDR